MKKLVLLCTLVVFYNHGKSQTQTATFKDGTKIDFEAFEKHGDERRTMIVGLSIMHYADVLSYVSLDYFKPDAFWAEVKVGYKFAEFHGMYFLKGNEVSKSHRVTLRSTYLGNTHAGYSTTLKHVVKIPMDIVKYFGIHGGYAIKQYESYSLIKLNGTFNEFAIGVGFFKSAHVRVRVQAPKKPLKKINENSLGLFADLLLNMPAGEVLDKYKETSASHSTIGFRLFLEGKNTGILYRLGAMRAADGSIVALVGFGFCFGVYNSK